MHPRQPIPPALAVLADQQEGVLSREQVLGSGLTRAVLERLLRQGPWCPLARGLCWTRGGDPPWLALAWGGVLLGGDLARLGPEASGHLWALRPEPPPVVDVLVPYARGCGAGGSSWHFRRERPGARSSRSVGAPPRLTAADTVLDLVAPATSGDVIALVTRAVQQRLVSTDSLLTALAQRQVHPRRRLLTTLLADVAEGVESNLELAYLRDVERAHGLPKGRRNRYRGGLRYRSDVGYDEYGLLVELDGRLGHADEGRFRDFRRDNAFALRELTTLRYGWFDVAEQPCDVTNQVSTVLHARGWSELPTRCRRCRRVL